MSFFASSKYMLGINRTKIPTIGVTWFSTIAHRPIRSKIHCASSEKSFNISRRSISFATRDATKCIQLWAPIKRRCFSSGNERGRNPWNFKKYLEDFLGPKKMPERHTFAWYREISLICTVFAITGSSTMILVRPAVSHGLGLQGSLWDGPWTYRICSLVIMTPIYASLLVVVGTVFGRHAYFRHFAVKMFSRFGIPPELLDSSFHETSKTFRKW